jgi:FkbM family methyltransferase
VRERLWLFLRRSRVLRKLYGNRALSGPMRAASSLLVPISGQRRLRVREGPAKGLIFELTPRWEHAAWEGNYELPVQELFIKFLAPGAVLFDIGANYGFFSLLAARLGADVYAFEPDKGNAEVLARHADMNHLLDRIHIIPSAVFSYSGEVALEPPTGRHAHGNAHTGVRDSLSGNTLQVPCVRLDDFIDGNPNPSLIKMDVEGAESEVLRGADRLFRMKRPRLLCEVHDESNAAFAQDWLKERDYNCRWVEAEGNFPRHLFAWHRNDQAA